ncbi:uncharacterized protein J3R85_019236 [Psidium guajava]|nr:uncharacterized protein J3R85_019236 [Psidium guajava]
MRAVAKEDWSKIMEYEIRENLNYTTKQIVPMVYKIHGNKVCSTRLVMMQSPHPHLYTYCTEPPPHPPNKKDVNLVSYNDIAPIGMMRNPSWLQARQPWPGCNARARAATLAYGRQGRMILAEW